MSEEIHDASRAESVKEVPERREETFSVGWFGGVGKRVIRSACVGGGEERARAFRGGYLLEKISLTRSNLLLAVNYYYRERCE